MNGEQTHTEVSDVELLKRGPVKIIVCKFVNTNDWKISHNGTIWPLFAVFIKLLHRWWVADLQLREFSLDFTFELIYKVRGNAV